MFTTLDKSTRVLWNGRKQYMGRFLLTVYLGSFWLTMGARDCLSVQLLAQTGQCHSDSSPPQSWDAPVQVPTCAALTGA